MKSTGIVRNIDALGRIVLPKELRGKFGIESGTALEIYVEGEKIILKVYNPSCIFCGEAKDIFSFNGKNVCPQCAAALGVQAEEN